MACTPARMKAHPPTRSWPETVFNKRHGGPWDRGSADFYYGRPKAPHYYKKGTGMSPRIDEADMNTEELMAYEAGYEEETDRKEWG